MVLFIDATVREASRTRILAEYLLEKLGETPAVLHLKDQKIPKLGEMQLEKRNALCAQNDYSDPDFLYAKQFAQADTIVLAAPFWDLSFPALLKEYIEAICINGIVFRYTEDGIPIGMCKAKKLYYITTSGGRIFNPDFGFGYIKALAQSLFGIETCVCIQVENLDIVGNDVDASMQKGFEEIDALFS